MTQPLQVHAIHDLLEFYDRVNPILSAWLAKPVWTAKETALLCAGFVPHDSVENESATADDFEEIKGAIPVDPHGYVPPDRQLCRVYFICLEDKEAASPLDMVKQINRVYPLMVGSETHLTIVGEQSSRKEVQREFRPELLSRLKWLLIIGNAVGLQVPALVPMGLLNALHGRLTSHAVNKSSTGQVRLEEKKGKKLDIESISLATELMPEVKPKTKQRKPRERQPLQIAPEERGYHTTEEVAGLTNLLPDTLNKYAREGIPVEGFTPFKRQNGRFWQWRDDQQQAEYKFDNVGQVKHRPK